MLNPKKRRKKKKKLHEVKIKSKIREKKVDYQTKLNAELDT